MATQIRARNASTRSVPAGSLTLGLGCLFAAAVAFTFVLSLGEVVHPPNWVRAIGLVWLPVGLFAIPVGYAVARTGEGRNRARIGLIIALVALAAFVGLVVALG